MKNPKKFFYLLKLGLIYFFISPLIPLQAQTNSWKNLFLEWNSTQANSGTGVVRSIRAEPKNPSTAIIGAATAGIWKTTNSGKDYTYVSKGILEVELVNEIIYSRSNPLIVYANTDIGVVKSTDGGDNWFYTSLRKNKPDKFRGEYSWIDVPINNSNVVYATTRSYDNISKLYKSTNGGTTWTELYETRNPIWDMRVKPDNGNIVYLLEQSGNWINFKKSTDGGVSFTTINNGYPANANTQAHRARLATTPANNNVVYIAIGYNGGNTNDRISFFKSTDNGNSFTKKCCGNASSPLVYAAGAKDFLSKTSHLAQLTWNFAFTISETDENFLVCAANKIKVSNDGGKTWDFDLPGSIHSGWQYANYPVNDAHRGIHGDHHGLSMIGKYIWNGNDGGVYLSKDGGNTLARDVTEGLGVQELWGFGQSFKNDVMAVGLNHNQICIRDDRVYGGWIGFNGADAMAANVNPIDDRYLYTHPWGDEKVTRSLTSKTGHIIKGLGISLGYISLDNLEFHPHQYYTIYGNDYHVSNNEGYRMVKTTNNADSWEIINDLRPQKANAISIKTSFANANYVYAVIEPNKVIKSTDEGKRWKDVSPPSSLIGSSRLGKIAVSDKDPNHIWVSTRQNSNLKKVFTSTDGGVTWSDYSTGLPDFNLYSLIYQRGSKDILYLGTSFGVYYRKAGMAKWELFGEDMPATKTPFMHINYAKGKIRVGTSRGLWENDLFERTAPMANISADKTVFTGNRATIKFADYSVVDQQATYKWLFPGGTPSSSTLERPTVTYNNANGKSFDVTLTVTDARGTHTQTLKNFIKSSSYVPTEEPDEAIPGDTTTSVYYVDSEETQNEDGRAVRAIDGDDTTFWTTQWSSNVTAHPHEIQIDLGTSTRINGFTYLPRQNNSNGRIKDYELYVSNTPNNWGNAVAQGTWDAGKDLKTLSFPTKSGRYYRLVALSSINGDEYTTAAELNIVEAPAEEETEEGDTAMSVHYVDSEETQNEDGRAVRAIDGDDTTFWTTQWSSNVTAHPHEIQIDLGTSTRINGFTYLPRQNNSNGRIKDYELYVSNTPNNWGNAVAQGTWDAGKDLKTLSFPTKSGRYYRLVALSSINGDEYTTAAELNIVEAPAEEETEEGDTTMSVYYVDSEETQNEDGRAVRTIDGDDTTFWTTQWSSNVTAHPHEIQIDLGTSTRINGFTYLPRQNNPNGRIKDYELYISNTPNNWGNAVAKGTWNAGKDLKTLSFPTKSGRYYRLVALSSINGDEYTTAAELNIVEAPAEEETEEGDTAMSVYYVDSEETQNEDGRAVRAIDGDESTFWTTQWSSNVTTHPHEIQIDLGTSTRINGFTYLPRQNNSNGRIKEYELYISNTPNNWGNTVAKGTWNAGKDLKTLSFPTKSGRYYRLVALSSINGDEYTTAAELNIVEAPVEEDVETSVYYVDSEETQNEDGRAVRAIDGDESTFWTTQWSSNVTAHPHEIQIDLGTSTRINGFTYLPRQNNSNGRIKDYELYISNTPNNWGNAVAEGTWNAGKDLKTLSFPTKSGRYYRLVALSSINGDTYTTAAELNIVEAGQRASKTFVRKNIKEENKASIYQHPLTLKAYPIPMSNFLNVAFEGDTSFLTNRQTKIRIFNSQNNLVFNKKFRTNDTIQIPTSNFASGIYFLNVSNGSYNKTIKIVKGNILLKKTDDE